MFVTVISVESAAIFDIVVVATGKLDFLAVGQGQVRQGGVAELRLERELRPVARRCDRKRGAGGLLRFATENLKKKKTISRPDYDATE